jgi:hypothetical protein
VGLFACRVTTGTYAGIVNSVVFDGERWFYTLGLQPGTMRMRVTQEKGAAVEDLSRSEGLHDS